MKGELKEDEQGSDFRMRMQKSDNADCHARLITLPFFREEVRSKELRLYDNHRIKTV